MSAGQRASAGFSVPGIRAAWRLHATDPGAAAPADGGRWLEIAGPATVAAALRERGEWSLDGPAQDFDAQDWWYAAHFDAPEDSASSVLRFQGLATLCDARLNGQPLFSSDSMFLARDADVGRLLRPRGNELLLRFGSLQAALARRRPRPRWRTPMVAHQQLRWLRTTLLGRTPGWSPPAAPVGPWRDIVWLDADQAALRWRLQAGLREGDGWVRLALDAPHAWLREGESAELVLRGPTGEHRQALAGRDAVLRVPRAARWWPHTHGEPVLYDASLRWQHRRGGSRVFALGRIGFRTIEIDHAGDGFTLRVNGVPVFCRGAGWTPLDVVSLRSEPEACRAALHQARAAGMNMLRLAGTLAYEEDHFYDACDELGLLVWQDFMFASMDYPFDDADFARSAEEEARQQLQRLHHHPCLAVLCGNSEVEQQAAMWGAPRELWRPAFFHETLPALCRDVAPATPYWPSSAHGGAFPHQACAGTTSYYGVGAYERPLEDARRSRLRFATECLAFANIPDAATLERLPGGLATRVHHPQWKTRSPRDLGAGWDFDDVRDHYVQRLFGIDPARLRHSDHDRYLAMGRLATAEAMRLAFSEWRRPGSGCGGALLLFLRDLWAGAGWGVLDDRGAPKAAFHALSRALQPLAVFMTDEGGNGVDVHLVNDRPQAWRGTLEIAAWRDGEVPIARGERQVDLPAHGGITLSCLDVLGTFLDLNHAYRFGPPACELLRARLLDASGREAAHAMHFPLGLAQLLAQRRDLGLRAEWAGHGDTMAVVVSTRSLALGVHFDLPGWAADDQHFHLAPGERRQVVLRRVRAAAPLGGQLMALNAAAPVPLEADA
jgi:beta-mannosidase